MEDVIRDLQQRVNPERLRDLTLELVSIPSPTGEAREVTGAYARHVEALGLPVEIVSDYPTSPSSIARMPGAGGGPTLTLDGHLDTIHTPHAAPEVVGSRIYGRGSGDMKSGVAAMVEATRVLLEAGVKLKGNLILATHSLHEAPIGHMEGLKALIARGDVFVDAALVAESSYDTLSVCGKGQSIFSLTISRPGEVLHENVARPQGVPNPLDYAAELAVAFLQADRARAGARHPMLGPETFFLGQVHGGDFYNRMANQAFVQGIYRFWPDKSWDDVQRTFEAIIAGVPQAPGLDLAWTHGGNGLGFEMAPDDPIVTALRQSYQQVVGRELPLVGGLSVCDANVITREGGVPAVAHGTGSSTAHADVEWVELDGIVRATRIYLGAIVRYLGLV
jgi:acetylornithine deacetylase/succinyl-diaminopimelate desuccinylase-like protein